MTTSGDAVSVGPTMSDKDGKPPILRLPSELLLMTCSDLTNRDIKNLRLVCRFLHTHTELRLHRVFISASPRDLAVFKAIADHDVFRHRVKEIIWDEGIMEIQSRKKVSVFFFFLLPD